MLYVSNLLVKHIVNYVQAPEHTIRPPENIDFSFVTLTFVPLHSISFPFFQSDSGGFGGTLHLSVALSPKVGSSGKYIATPSILSLGILLQPKSDGFHLLAMASSHLSSVYWTTGPRWQHRKFQPWQPLQEFAKHVV